MPVLNVLSILSIGAAEYKRLGKFVSDCALTLTHTKMKMIKISNIIFLCLFECLYGTPAGTEIQ